MDYQSRFAETVEDVRHEGRYRVFAHLERVAGRFPHAINHGPGPDEVGIWCSNDYLGQGCNPVVIEAGREAMQSMGAGSGGTRNRQQPAALLLDCPSVRVTDPLLRRSRSSPRRR